MEVLFKILLINNFIFLFVLNLEDNMILPSCLTDKEIGAFLNLICSVKAFPFQVMNAISGKVSTSNRINIKVTGTDFKADFIKSFCCCVYSFWVHRAEEKTGTWRVT